MNEQLVYIILLLRDHPSQRGVVVVQGSQMGTMLNMLSFYFRTGLYSSDRRQYFVSLLIESVATSLIITGRSPIM